jgi:hypothetical protein
MNITKQMLILTGPQGAGNHLWSKVFSLHPEVFGWKTLLENYWEAHRFAEPFASCWRDTAGLDSFDWSQSDYYFTSISVPLGIPGSDLNPLWVPDVKDFVAAVQCQGVSTAIAVIGRDQNILRYQQTRIRTRSTVDLLLDQLDSFSDIVFLSYELLYLYRHRYLKQLAVNIPVAWADDRLEKILQDDANAKYIHEVGPCVLDQGNQLGLVFKEKP